MVYFEQVQRDLQGGLEKMRATLDATKIELKTALNILNEDFNASTSMVRSDDNSFLTDELRVAGSAELSVHSQVRVLQATCKMMKLIADALQSEV